jgi:hypothetical protein
MRISGAGRLWIRYQSGAGQRRWRCGVRLEGEDEETEDPANHD